MDTSGFTANSVDKFVFGKVTHGNMEFILSIHMYVRKKIATLATDTFTYDILQTCSDSTPWINVVMIADQ